MSIPVVLVVGLVYCVGYLVVALSTWNRFVDESSMPMDFVDFVCGIWCAVAAGMLWPFVLIALGAYRLSGASKS